ncbi:MAG: ATP-dependent helicase [Sporomusaceae bacterium]|nr:ATP-dependent helicase [Sporomusaceae bacterium]
MALLDGLNKEQYQAVTSTAPNILCLAGAGSGKTTVLTRRIAQLHQEYRVGTSNMLALTFTRLAALEMKERVIRLIGDEQGKQLTCSTFHAFAVSVLRRWGHKLGIDENFTIYDQEDRDLIIKQIISDFGSRITFKKVITRYELCVDVREEDRKYPEESKVLKEYGYRCRRNNAVDLNRLVDLVVRLWELHPDILAEYQQRFTYVFVDEFQDTNDEQNRMCELLNPKNSFLVGDDFQAIYGWRGANVEHIIKLAQRSGIEVIKLEENYRSTSCIVAAANALISNNLKQTKKILQARRTGHFVQVKLFENDREEAKAIANKIKSLRETKGLQYQDFAVLARTNKQIENIDEIFKSVGIASKKVTTSNDPYKAYAVKGILDWMQFLFNRKDNMALKKVLWKFKSKALLMEQIELMAIQKDISLYDAICETNSMSELIQTVRTLDEGIEKQNIYLPSEMFDFISSTLGINQNVAQLAAAKEAIETWQKSKLAVGENVTVQGFLKYLRYKDVQEKLVENVDAVKLMTVHAAKGLEFNTVFVVGMNQNVFPSKRSEDLEEERRLFYVAITRAKERLCITYSKFAADWSGDLQPMEPSDFLYELGEAPIYEPNLLGC